MVVEVGILLDKDLEYYHNMLLEYGFSNVYNVRTHDIYWTNRDLRKLSENEMKRSCVRFRHSVGFGGEKFTQEFSDTSGFQNYQIFDSLAEDSFGCPEDDLDQFIHKFKQYGFKRIFDTKKIDYQYKLEGMKSIIQLQDIEGIGLVLYYDNPDYYQMNEKMQRKMLIEEVNSYGFNISKRTLGIDKLRSLYYGKICYSLNQNS